MLSQLYIENIAVIEKASIDFQKGLNVLTGETGAGKSILIDSINAVLGERTSRELVRTGSKKSRVSALFNEVSSETSLRLRDLGYDCEDETVLLQRDISAEGKSTCRINGIPATVSILKEVGSILLNIHGQHDNYELLSPEIHMTYIDRIGVPEKLLEAYKESYYRWEGIRKKIRSMEMDESEKIRRTDLLRYQIDELEAAQIHPGEKDELSEQRTIYNNSEKIVSYLTEAMQILDGDDSFNGAVSELQTASSSVAGAEKYLPEAGDLSERLQSLSYELEDCASEIHALFAKTEYDPMELEEINERLDLLYRLGLKYGSTEKEMLSHLEACKEELQSIEFSEDILLRLQDELKTAYEEMCDLAQQLSQKRKEAGKSFSARVKEELTFLNMPNIEFITEQTVSDFYELGCDKIQFLISTNPGEPPKPLAKIASGGELSRIMLAIKTVLAGNDRIATLIFDEIDTGISGSAAQKVGQKLKEVSRQCQVICVTHSAQIAALADTHYLIEKHIHENRTFTEVRALETEERIHEIARIMGGEVITKLMLENSAEMLKLAQNS